MSTCHLRSCESWAEGILLIPFDLALPFSEVSERQIICIQREAHLHSIYPMRFSKHPSNMGSMIWFRYTRWLQPYRILPLFQVLIGLFLSFSWAARAIERFQGLVDKWHCIKHASNWTYQGFKNNENDKGVIWLGNQTLITVKNTMTRKKRAKMKPSLPFKMGEREGQAVEAAQLASTVKGDRKGAARSPCLFWRAQARCVASTLDQMECIVLLSMPVFISRSILY